MNDLVTDADIDALQLASREQLIQAWQDLFRAPPAKKLSRNLMCMALKYEMQCDQEGGLSARDRRAFAGELRPASRRGKTVRPSAPAGSHLIREWNGRSYQVAVTDNGYLLDGKRYRSLSAVAKQITGAHWSGPRFFGVAI